MPKQIPIAALICTFLAIFNPCSSQNFYIPLLYLTCPANMPMASQKGDYSFGVYLRDEGGSQENQGVFGLQTSYAVGKHVILLADIGVINVAYPHGYPNIWDGPAIVIDNIFSGNIGAGYYTTFGKSWRFEALGGLGYGTSAFYEEDYAMGRLITDLKDTTFRGWLQADIASCHKYYQYGAGFRFMSIYSHGVLDRTETYSPNLIDLKGNNLFAEPSVYLAGKIGILRVKGTLGYSFLLNKPIATLKDYYYGGPVLALGLYIDLLHNPKQADKM